MCPNKEKTGWKAQEATRQEISLLRFTFRLTRLSQRDAKDKAGNQEVALLAHAMIPIIFRLLFDWTPQVQAILPPRVVHKGKMGTENWADFPGY